MIPGERYSSEPVTGLLLNPWSRDEKVSHHWGPVQVQDPSQGMLVKVWTLEADEKTVTLSAPGSLPIVLFSRLEDIKSVSLSFDQNGRPYVAFEEVPGSSYLYWFDPVPNAYVFMPVDGAYPIITLDDARFIDGGDSDVILSYIRDEAIRYWQQRDRYTIEYTPTEGPLGPPVRADILYHVSMNSRFRLEWLYGDLPTILDAPNIMHKQILVQKAPAETLPIKFNFHHLMLFGEVITAAAVTISVHSGEDAVPSSMLNGSPVITDWEVTQSVQGGSVGAIYLVSMSARTNNNCVYVLEGLLCISESVAAVPEVS